MPLEHDIRSRLTANLSEAAGLLRELDALAEPLSRGGRLIADCLLGGNKLLCCGNGGSAGDAAHLSSEIANRYILDRRGYPALDLTADHNLITALINDYPPEMVFARQIEALGREGDVLVVFTTSGNSANILAALDAAHSGGLQTIAFLGKGGGRCRGRGDVELIVPSQVTARVQECHLLLLHTLCDVLDPLLAAG